MTTDPQIEFWACMLGGGAGRVDENVKFKSDAEAKAAVREFADQTRRNQGAYALAFRLAENAEKYPVAWYNRQLQYRAVADDSGIAALRAATREYGKAFRVSVKGLVYHDKTEIAGRRTVKLGIIRDKPSIQFSDYTYAYFFEAGPSFSLTKEFLEQLDILDFGAKPDGIFSSSNNVALINPLHGMLTNGLHSKELDIFMKAHAWRFEKTLRSVRYADAYLLAKAVRAVVDRLNKCTGYGRRNAARDNFKQLKSETRRKNTYKLRVRRLFDAGLFNPAVFEDLLDNGKCPRAVLRLAAMSTGYYEPGEQDGEDDEYGKFVSDMECEADTEAGVNDGEFCDYVKDELDVADMFQEELAKLILDGFVKKPEDFKTCVDAALKAWSGKIKELYRIYRQQAYGD